VRTGAGKIPEKFVEIALMEEELKEVL